MRIPALILVVAVLAAPAASAQGTTPEAALRHQLALFKQAKWRALYATFTPRLRRSCPYARFVANQRATRRILGTNFRLGGIRTRMETRSRAIVAYSYVRNGRTIVRVTLRDRDVYVRVGSRWLDERDRVTTC